MVWFILFFVVTSSSCEKDDNKSPLNELESFEIEELDASFKISDGVVSAMVPAGTDLTNLTPVFEVSEKAKVYIGNEIVESGVSKYDFSEGLDLVVEAENGDRNTYTVVVGKKPGSQPVADAGADQIVYVSEGETSVNVSLDGSESQAGEGDVSGFSWELDGEEVASGAEAEVDLTVGTYNIVLIVENSLGDTHADEVVIDVREATQYAPVDPNATEETKNLLMNLGKIANGPEFIFGQEFPMSFKLGELRWDLSTSDAREVTGDHPGVFGIDPHYMLYKSDDQRDLHIQEARYAYENGGIVTFDFHQQSRFDNKIYIDDISNEKDKSLMYDIVNDLDGSREWYLDELDVIINWINDDLGFPVVFRLFHEMNGGWFWWGTEASQHSPELYKDFFRLTVDYLKEHSNLVLFSWSPNHPFNTDYYPGNAYVDVVGVDMYEPGKSQLTSLLKEVSAFAEENNKIAALTETGQRDDYINNHPDFWTSTILGAIKDGGDDINIAWVLAWFNAPWHSTSTQEELFIPNADSPSNAKNSFIDFYQDDHTLFLNETESRNVYE
ncbi:MAG: glycosyl hydrolase [Bacteroidota bacterium]